MNGVPLVGHPQFAPSPCPATAPHVVVENGDQVKLCRFCGGYGVVLIDLRKLQILDIRGDAPQGDKTASAALVR